MLRSILTPRAAAQRQAIRTPVPPPSDRSRLLLCLLDELRTSFVLAGITTNTLNAFGRNPTLLCWIAAFVPSDPIIFPSAKANLIDGIDSSQLQYATHFYRHLPLAKLSLNTLLGDADPRSLKEVCDTWRSLCGIAELAMKEMDRYFCHDDPNELYLSDDIRRLLIAVKAGQSPCLINGRPEMPAWFQRRHQPRVQANLVAHLRYGQMTAPVLVVNISVGGCGVEQAPPLPLEAIVELRLESGRLLEAAVRWQNGTRAGLLFSTPLSYRDPLISAG
ncbi:MAG: PilZ domain-containing protein [Hyphomicrobiaceae bacterium]|nr:MAG: PilZ domain-containing protein [Hyphomicrobiaceae bacterium]